MNSGKFALFIFLLSGIQLFSESTLAATIEVSQTGAQNLVSYSGPVERGDYATFVAKVANLNNAIVLLSSGGGDLQAGLKIGQYVREHGFITEVPKLQICASACSFIWLGGKERVVSDGARVGFHAVYLNDGVKTISSSGNALVGAYMSRLGFNDLAIQFATDAAPSDIRWLSPKDASYLDISVKWASAIEDPSRVYSAILSKSDIEAALLKRKAIALLKAQNPTAYERLVGDIFAAGATGKSWSKVLLETYGDIIGPLVLNDDVNNGAAFSSQEVFKLIMQMASYSDKHGSKSCADYKTFDSYLIGQLDYALIDAYSMTRGDLVEDFIKFFELTLEATLSNKQLKLGRLSATQKVKIEREIKKLFRTHYQALPAIDRKQIDRSKDVWKSKADCKFFLNFMKQASSNPRLFKLLGDYGNSQSD